MHDDYSIVANTDAIAVTFYLKSGQSFTVHMRELTRKYNGSGQFVALEWENMLNTPEHTFTDLSYIDVADISAIVIVR